MQENEAFELQDWIQLSNGCACCSVKNDFVKALESLMSKAGMYDYILIETTGASWLIFELISCSSLCV